MKNGSATLLGLIAAVAVICGSELMFFIHWETENREWDAQASWFLLRNPVVDAREAFHRNDIRFIATFGVGLCVPGLPADWSLERFYTEKCGVNPVEGTGCVITSNAKGRFQSAVIQYARAYNAELLGLVRGELAPETGKVKAVLEGLGGHLGVLSGRIMFLKISAACVTKPDVRRPLMSLPDLEEIELVSDERPNISTAEIETAARAINFDVSDSRVGDTGSIKYKLLRRIAK